MGIIETLINNYMYFLIVAGFLILALIGYVVDLIKTDKLKKELASGSQLSNIDIPLAPIQKDMKMSESISDAMKNLDSDMPHLASKMSSTTKDEQKLGDSK